MFVSDKVHVFADSSRSLFHGHETTLRLRFLPQRRPCMASCSCRSSSASRVAVVSRIWFWTWRFHGLTVKSMSYESDVLRPGSVSLETHGKKLMPCHDLWLFPFVFSPLMRSQWIVETCRVESTRRIAMPSWTEAPRHPRQAPGFFITFA